MAGAALDAHGSHPLGAHASHPLAGEALRRWSWEPYTVALLVLSGVIYAKGTRALWARAGAGRGVQRWQTVAFAGGLLSLAVALISPVSWLSQILFSVHMTQHEILMLVSAPLLVFGHPVLAILWAMPKPAREAWGRWTDRRAVAAAWKVMTRPLTAFVLNGAALWVWHIPRLYEAALRNEAIHALEHLSFVLTAALFWWGMAHGRYGKMGYGAAVVYVFLTAVHSSVLGALVTVAPAVWYPAYTVAAAAWQMNPLEDQQLAGLLMWVPSGVVFIVFGLALFAAWLGESDKRVKLGTVTAAAVRPAPRVLLTEGDDAA
jgi:cytochrome c oxidase assembly factor CtaG